MRRQRPDVRRLYQAHARQVWRTIARLGVPAAAVEDAVQDVFLTAHQKAADFDGRASPSTWLIGIAVRVAANVRRSGKRRALAVVPSSSDGAPTPHEQLERRRDLEALDATLSKLAPEQREVVVLMDLEHLSAPEVAEVLGVNVNTVYSRLRLGRAALSRALKGEEVAS
ncbi:MAG: RNA polymerase sigma factor [Myxococcota bacterium]